MHKETLDDLDEGLDTKSFLNYNKPSPNAKNLIIVDGLNLAFRWKHRNSVDFAAEYLRTVTSLAKSYKGKDVVLLSDMGRSLYRVDVSPDYKGDRKKLQETQTAEEKEAFQAFLVACDKAYELCERSHTFFRLKNVEADDIAAYIVKNYGDKYEHIWLISTDRDWDLLLSENVSRFSYVSRKEFTLDNFYEEHGCDTPEQYISLKCLSGDSGDSVAGIHGIGPKRGYGLLREYGTALDIYDAIPLDAGNKKLLQEINKSGEMIPMNYKLMDLLSFCEDAIQFPDPTNIDKINEMMEKF